jgi:hypothetical protein
MQTGAIEAEKALNKGVFKKNLFFLYVKLAILQVVQERR